MIGKSTTLKPVPTLDLLALLDHLLLLLRYESAVECVSVTSFWKEEGRRESRTNETFILTFLMIDERSSKSRNGSSAQGLAVYSSDFPTESFTHFAHFKEDELRMSVARRTEVILSDM